ncbi:MAG: YjjG family noncanonical pyrimidine nucleotidase [Ferruginibacter sp.]
MKPSTGKTYQHLFFDLDHTLWDFETNAEHTMRSVYAEFMLDEKINAGFDIFFKNYSVHNKLLWDRYQKGFIGVEELKWKRMWRTLLDFKIGDESLARSMSVRFLEILPTQNRTFPHTHEILTYLKEKNYRLHLITNGFEKTQRSKLQHSQIDHFFDCMITSENSNSMKPNPAIFAHALQESGASVDTSIMIGDNPEADIEGAANAGWDTVFVNHIQAEPIQQATFEVTHLSELATIF